MYNSLRLHPAPRRAHPPPASWELGVSRAPLTGEAGQPAAFAVAGENVTLSVLQGLLLTLTLHKEAVGYRESTCPAVGRASGCGVWTQQGSS